MPNAVKAPTTYVRPDDDGLEFVNVAESRSGNEQLMVTWLQSFPVEGASKTTIRKVIGRYVYTWPHATRIFGMFGRALVKQDANLFAAGLESLLKGLASKEKAAVLDAFGKVLAREGGLDEVAVAQD